MLWRKSPRYDSSYFPPEARKPDEPHLSHLIMIASTGRDSVTMPIVEMMAPSLPLIVSELHGQNDTVEDGVCSYPIRPYDYKIHPPLRQRRSNNPRSHLPHTQAANITRPVIHFFEHIQVERPPFSLVSDEFFSDKKHSDSEARQ